MILKEGGSMTEDERVLKRLRWMAAVLKEAKAMQRETHGLETLVADLRRDPKPIKDMADSAVKELVDHAIELDRARGERITEDWEGRLEAKAREVEARGNHQPTGGDVPDRER